jgi:hypothetical protein
MGLVMVMWCKECGALMGVKEPIEDWSMSHGICAACLKRIASPLTPRP